MDTALAMNSLAQTLAPLPWGICAFSRLPRLLECRAAQRIPANAQSVILCLFPYRIYDEYPDHNLSKYAVVPDYHRVVMQYLERAADALRQLYPDHSFACFVDNSPIPEVSAAAMAGLGVIGQNGLLIHPDYGSYLFIGEIVTDLPLPAADAMPRPCLNCGRCVAQCPGKALRAGAAIALDRCLSHLTQTKQPLTAEQEVLIRSGELIWGCDRCSDICPMNRGVKLSPIPEFYQDPIFQFTGEETAAQIKQRAFGFRGKAPLIRNLTLQSREEESR